MGFFPVDANTIDFLAKTGRARKRSPLLKLIAALRASSVTRSLRFPVFQGFETGSEQGRAFSGGTETSTGPYPLEDMGKISENPSSPRSKSEVSDFRKPTSKTVPLEIVRRCRFHGKDRGLVWFRRYCFHHELYNTSNPNLMISAGFLPEMPSNGAENKAFCKNKSRTRVARRYRLPYESRTSQRSRSARL